MSSKPPRRDARESSLQQVRIRGHCLQKEGPWHGRYSPGSRASGSQPGGFSSSGARTRPGSGSTASSTLRGNGQENEDTLPAMTPTWPRGSCPYSARARGEGGGIVISLSGARSSSSYSVKRRSGLRTQKRWEHCPAQTARARGLTIQHRAGPTRPRGPA